MSFQLPELPFAPDALAPHMSAETFEFHHGKHHNAYVTNLNKLIDGTENADKSLDEIISIGKQRSDSHVQEMPDHRQEADERQEHLARS